MIKQWLEQLLLRWAMKNFTIGNLRLLIDRVVAFLKVRAAETDTVADDWAIDALESILKDESKLTVIYDWINRFIKPEEDGVCRAVAEPTDEQFDELAQAVSAAGIPENNCASIPVKEIESILRIILPVIIDYFRKK